MSIADGDLADKEIDTLKNIAIGLDIPSQYLNGIIQDTFESIKNRDK
jgi:hypothetical protein